MNSNTAEIFPMDRNIVFPLYNGQLLSILTKVPSIDDELTICAMTGFVQQKDECAPDDAAPFSYMTGCDIELPFCRVRRDASDVEIDRVLRQSLGNTLTSSQALDRATANAMQEAGLLLLNEVSRQLWSGSGKYGEMIGLDTIISTGCVKNSEHRERCMGYVEDFQGYDIASTERDIVEFLSTASYHLQHKAMSTKMNPVTWSVIMRPELWDELSVIWGTRIEFRSNRGIIVEDWTCEHCGKERGVDLTVCIGGCGGAREPTYNQYVCLYCGRVYLVDKAVCWDADSGTSCGAIDATLRIGDVEGLSEVVEGNREFGDWMMREQKLLINGYLYDVALDSHVPEQDVGNGVFRSAIYFVPLTILGRTPVTFLNFVDYKHPSTGSPRSSPGDSFWSDGGMYAWTLSQSKWDYRLSVQANHRVVCLTPQLGGVIKNVSYEPIQHPVS